MLDGLILGVIQGVAEWVPVSSEGALVLAQLYLTPGVSLREMIELALFLHLGTLLSAVVYFRNDVRRILRTIVSYRRAPAAERKLTEFLLLTTIISGCVGYIFFASIEESMVDEMQLTGRAVMGAIGAFLLVTAALQLKGKQTIQEDRGGKDITGEDTVIVGTAQAFSVLPGLSRSGLTVAALLLRGFKEEEALRLSFLMSIPIVFAGNVALNFTGFTASSSALVGFVVAFIVGLGTIRALFALAHKVNFGYFVLVFGLLTILAAFI